MYMYLYIVNLADGIYIYSQTRILHFLFQCTYIRGFAVWRTGFVKESLFKKNWTL